MDVTAIIIAITAIMTIIANWTAVFTVSIIHRNNPPIHYLAGIKIIMDITSLMVITPITSISTIIIITAITFT